MSTEANKAINLRFYEEVMTQKNYDALTELVCEDFAEENPPPGQEQGRDGLRRWFESHDPVFPDMRVTVEDIVAEGDTVAVRLTLEGSHQGTFLGMAATGRRLRVEAQSFNRMRDGKIASTHFLLDAHSLIQQLGSGPS